MQVEAVQISTALDWAIRLIGGLVALNLGTLVYIFKSLKSEVIDSLEERVLLMEGRHPEHRHDSQD